MSGFEHIKRCLELADRDIVFAMEERLVCKALLDRLSSISRPGEGAPKLLLIFARMASQACDWIDGDLRVEIVGDPEASVIEVLTDLGAGMRERIFPSFTMKVPLDEFTRAVERVPHMVEPLAIAVKTTRRIVLSATEAVRLSSLPPAMVEIDSESLYGSVDLRAPPLPALSTAPRPMSPGKMRVQKIQPLASEAPPSRAPAMHKASEPKHTAPPDLATSARAKVPTAPRLPAPSIASPPSVSKPPLPPRPAPKMTKAKSQRPPPLPASAARPKAKSIPPAAKGKSQAPPLAKTKSSKPPKTKSLKPPAKEKSMRPPGPSTRAKAMVSEPPPSEAEIDTGWDDIDS